MIQKETQFCSESMCMSKSNETISPVPNNSNSENI